MSLRLAKVRECDGQCCRDKPRWPSATGDDCIFHDAKGCRIKRGVAEVPGDSEIKSVRPCFTNMDIFIRDCRQWPQHHCRPRPDRTKGCCWQWVEK